MARDFKIELDNVEMINGSDDLLKDTKVTKVTITGENKLNSLNSTFENCDELTSIEGEVNLDGVSDMTEMTLNTSLDELKVINPTEENIQANDSLNQIGNVKIGGTKYSKGGVQDVVGSLDWNAENFVYEDAILDNVYTNSASIEESKNITVSDTLEQKATSIEITGQTYENLVDGKATENLLDEMSMQQTEGKPTQFTPHMEQPICLEYIEGQTYQNLIEGKGEYKLTDTFSTTLTESNNSIENPPSMIEIPEIWGNTVQGLVNLVTAKQIVDSINNATWNEGFEDVSATLNQTYNTRFTMSREQIGENLSSSNESWIKLKPNTTYSCGGYTHHWKLSFVSSVFTPESGKLSADNGYFTTGASGNVLFVPDTYSKFPIEIFVAEGKHNLCHLVSENELREIFDLKNIRTVGDLYVDEEGEAILDEEGNEQYKLEIKSHSRNLWDGKTYHKGRKQHNKKWGAIDSQFTANWDLKEPYGVQYDITNSSMRGPTIPIECLEAGKYINLTFKVTMPQYNPNITVHFFDSNKAYIGNIFNRWDGGLSGNITDSGAYFGGLIPDGATCCEIVFALSQNTNDVPYPQHIEITNLMVTVDDSAITSYRECEPQQSNKTTILMPQPLRKGGYERFSPTNVNNNFNKPLIDKIVYENGKYTIKKKVFESTIKEGFKSHSANVNVWWKLLEEFPSDVTDVRGYTTIPNAEIVFYGELYIRVNKSDFPTIEDANNYIPIDFIANYSYSTSSDKMTIYEETIETKILEKPSLDAYSPKTYITTNTEIQPSQMTVTNKKVDYIPLGLQPNKDYTLQLDSIGKNDKPITVNLGGTEATIQPINDTSKHHKVVVRTPSTLTTDKLALSGEGVVVNDVMLFEGGDNEIRQEVEYVEGIESIGELQEDGTYKIDILSNNKNLFDKTQYYDLKTNNEGSLNSFYYKSIQLKPNTQYCIYSKFNEYIDRLKICNSLNRDENVLADSAVSSEKSIQFITDNTGKIYIHITYYLSEANLKKCLDNALIQIEQGNSFSGYVEHKKNQTSILLPQPLNKIGEIKDKFYWDEDKGHYCIEQNTSLKIFDKLTFSGGSVSNNVFSGWGGFNIDGGINEKIKPIISHNNRHIKEVFLYYRDSYTEINISIKDCTSIDDANIKLNEDLPLTVLFARATPNIIDLPHLNKKYSVDTYMPNTYIDCPLNPLQPSKLLLKSDTIRYDSIIKPNTLYTIQFNCLKETIAISTLNLGGTIIEVVPTIGLNHFTITTSNTLTSNELSIIDSDSRFIDVIVNEGEMNQYPKYFDGVQSVGELQDDGSYIIGIKTNEGFNIFIQTNNPLTKDDKLYWNPIDRRYEIDRSGSIEIPTVTGDIVDLPRLYQKEDSTINISTDNIEPSKIEIEYKDINNN